MNTIPSSILENLLTNHGIRAFTALSQHGHTIEGQGTRLIQLQHPELGPLSGIFVEVPVDVSIDTSERGTLENVRVKGTADEDIEEALSHIKRLVRRGQIDADNRADSSQASHTIETDNMGRRILVRCRYA